MLIGKQKEFGFTGKKSKTSKKYTGFLTGMKSFYITNLVIFLENELLSGNTLQIIATQLISIYHRMKVKKFQQLA